MRKEIIDNNYIDKRYEITGLHSFPLLQEKTTKNTNVSNDLKFKRITDNISLYEVNNKKNLIECYEDKIKNNISEIENIAYEKGYEIGKEEGRKEIIKAIESMNIAIIELNKYKDELKKITEIEAVNLSLAIAKKIVGHEITIQKEVIIKIIKEALLKVEGHEKIKVKINPDDLNNIEKYKSELNKIAKNDQEIAYIGDQNIKKGGCIIETNIGDIDARIEKQFQVIEDQFNLECDIYKPI